MENGHKFLVDWAVNFIKNKDIMAKKIENIELGKDGFDIYVKYRDKEQYIIAMPAIAEIDSILSKLKDNLHYMIVTLNSHQNLSKIIENWSKLANFKFLSIVFANPFSSLDKRWIIFPYTHNKICDVSSLKTGLKSVFESVEPIDEIQFDSRFTS